MTVPVGGASVLPQNLHLRFEVELAGYISKILSGDDISCEECIDGRDGPAEVFCCSCYRFMCIYCHEYHKRNKKLSEHKLVELNQDGARELHRTMKPKVHYCSLHTHEDNKLNFYCTTCNFLVCRDCTVVVHKGHNVCEVSTVAKAYEKEITKQITDAKMAVAELKKAVVGNEKTVEQVEITKMNVYSTMNQAFDKVQNALEERKTALMHELESIALSKITALNLQKEQYGKTIELIDYYIEMASNVLQTHTDNEVAALGGLVKTKLQSELQDAQTISLIPNKDRDILVSMQAGDLVTKLNNLGCLAELSPSASSWKSTFAKVGSILCVELECKFSMGEACMDFDIQVKGVMISKAHPEVVVQGDVDNNLNGTYTISFIPVTAGPHKLHITLQGQHVKNSPDDIDVWPNYDTLFDDHEVIMCNSSPYCVAIHESGDIYVGSSDNFIYVYKRN